MKSRQIYNTRIKLMMNNRNDEEKSFEEVQFDIKR